MKSAFTLVFVFLILKAQAQGPTLTSDNSAPVIGDVYANQSALSAGISFGSAGANQIWNYNNLTDSSTPETYTVIATSATPYADSFPGSNIALSYLADDSTYQFLSSSASGLKALGVTAGSDSVIRYTLPKTIFPYPFSFGNSFTDTVALTIPAFGYTFNGRDTFFADGYGSLELPGRFYANVLRIKVIENISSTVDLGGTPGTINLQTVTYYYLTPGIHVPLLSIAETTISFLGIVTTTTDVSYLKSFSLPLRFLSFSAGISEGNVLLNWRTANEENTDIFNIQQSLNGTAFTTIGKVAANGVFAGSSYSYTDKTFQKTGAPVVYYRIQEQDKDGKLYYSGINVVNAPAGILSVYPNPATSFVKLNIKEGATASAVKIYNTRGQLLSNWNNFPANRLLDVSTLQRGTYLIAVTVNKVTTTSAIIKQ